MANVPHPGRLVPFSRPLGASARIDGETALELRPFGAEPDDLDLELRRGDRPGVVTELLRRCCRSTDGAVLREEFFWGLPVGTRIHALVVLCMAVGWGEVGWTVRCPSAGCDEQIDIALPLAELVRAAEARADHASVEVRWGQDRFFLRLPTGEDLRRWAARLPSDADMLAALGYVAGSSGDLPDGLAPAAESALASSDPLVDVRVRSSCPTCDRELDLPVDVEGAALALIASAQDERFWEVRTLAEAFHWSEREILELPTGRRRRYLRMLEPEEA